MPLEIARPSGRTRRIRFKRNACYVGVDYGPAFPVQIVDVQEEWALDFVRRGVAEFVPVGVPVAPEVPATPAPAEVAMPAAPPELPATPEEPAPKRTRRSKRADAE